MSGNSPEQQRQDAQGPNGARTDGGQDQSRPPQPQQQQTPKAPKPVIVSSASAAGRSGDDSQSGSVTSSPPTASNDSTASSYGHGDDIYGVVTVSPLPLNMGWKHLRDYVQRVVDPSIQIARTRMLPGVGKLRIKSMAATVTCASQLNNTVIAGNTVTAVPGPDEDLLHPAGPPPPPGMHVHSPGYVYSPIMAPPQQLNHWTTTQSPMPQPGAYLTPGHVQVYPGVYGTAQYSGTSPDMWTPPPGATPSYYGGGSMPAYGFRPGGQGPGRPQGINPSMMDKQRLFIGNIPFTTQWQDLKDHLRQAGNIYRVEIPEYDDGRSKGFAIATFYTEEDAKNAIQMFDKTDFNGREINVRYDKYRRWNNPAYQGPPPTQWVQQDLSGALQPKDMTAATAGPAAASGPPPPPLGHGPMDFSHSMHLQFSPASSVTANIATSSEDISHAPPVEKDPADGTHSAPETSRAQPIAPNESG